MLDTSSLPRGYAVTCNIVALYSKSLNVPTERVWTVIKRLLVRAHCAPIFFFQQCSLVGINIFTGEDPQSE